MDKYSGMNIVESKVRASNEVVKKNKRGGNGLKTLGMQFAVALAIFCSLICAKFLGGSASEFCKKVKDAVCFDTVGYAVSIIEDIGKRS